MVVDGPTAGQVMGLAPDDASRRAALRLADGPGPWVNAGYDERAVWASCRGSAREPYEVVCDLAPFGYRCSCPSRKAPCKHVLALLLMRARASGVLSAGPAPPEVAAWLALRPPAEGRSPWADLPSVEGWPAGEGPESRGIEASRRAAVADPQAAAARAEQRIDRIRAGMAELSMWMGDLLRHGLGWAQSQPYGYWDAMAARLVDAQAPAAAAVLRDLPSVVRRGGDWPGRVLGRLARLHLLCRGWQRYQSLPPEVQADLRTAAGWPWPRETVLAGPTETDRWYVLARATVDEDDITVQRTWLWGAGSGRPGLIVDFARPGAAFAWELWPGQALDATVARYPGSAPLRVLVADRAPGSVAEAAGEGAASSTLGPAGPPPGWDSLDEMCAARGRYLARDVWMARWPVSVKEVLPRFDRGGACRWSLTDRPGARMELAVDDSPAWKMMAVSGGRPVHVLGEWGDEGLVPLGVWAEERMVVL